MKRPGRAGGLREDGAWRYDATKSNASSEAGRLRSLAATRGARRTVLAWTRRSPPYRSGPSTVPTPSGGAAANASLGSTARTAASEAVHVVTDENVPAVLGGQPSQPRECSTTRFPTAKREVSHARALHSQECHSRRSARRNTCPAGTSGTRCACCSSDNYGTHILTGACRDPGNQSQPNQPGVPAEAERRLPSWFGMRSMVAQRPPVPGSRAAPTALLRRAGEDYPATKQRHAKTSLPSQGQVQPGTRCGPCRSASVAGRVCRGVRVEKIARALTEAGHHVSLLARNRRGLPEVENSSKPRTRLVPWSWHRSGGRCRDVRCVLQSRWFQHIRDVAGTRGPTSSSVATCLWLFSSILVAKATAHPRRTRYGRELPRPCLSLVVRPSHETHGTGSHAIPVSQG